MLPRSGFVQGMIREPVALTCRNLQAQLTRSMLESGPRARAGVQAGGWLHVRSGLEGAVERTAAGGRGMSVIAKPWVAETVDARASLPAMNVSVARTLGDLAQVNAVRALVYMGDQGCAYDDDDHDHDDPRR